MRAIPNTNADGGRFHPGFILADPYATRVVPVVLPEAAYTAAPKLLPAYDLKQPVLLGSLSAFTEVRIQMKVAVAVCMLLCFMNRVVSHMLVPRAWPADCRHRYKWTVQCIDWGRCT